MNLSEWTLEALESGMYKVELSIARSRIRLKLQVPSNKIICTLQENGWRQTWSAGEDRIAKRKNIVTGENLEAASLKLKSLELIIGR